MIPDRYGSTLTPSKQKKRFFRQVKHDTKWKPAHFTDGPIGINKLREYIVWVNDKLPDDLKVSMMYCQFDICFNFIVFRWSAKSPHMQGVSVFEKL